MNVRRLVCGIVSAGMMIAGAACAHASEYCWTTMQDVYYHADEHCGGAGERYPITEPSAIAFEKLPCPVCMENKAPEEISGVVRAGTYVVCIPADAAGENAPDGVPVEGNIRYDGDEAVWLLPDLIGADEYEALMEEFEANGSAMGTYAVIGTDFGADSLMMNRRRIDDNWYILVRPEKAYGDKNPFEWRTSSCNVCMDAGVTEIVLEQEMRHSTRMELENKNDSSAVFERNYGEVSISIYREMGANIAVVYRKDDGSGGIRGILRIGESGGSDIRVNGYINGDKKQVYCCVLTDGEFGSLVAGKTPVFEARQ